MFDEFDDGQYYSTVHDSADNPKDFGYKHHREICRGYATRPYRISKEWVPRGVLVEVDDLYFDESEHPEASVAAISRDAETIEVERQRGVTPARLEARRSHPVARMQTGERRRRRNSRESVVLTGLWGLHRRPGPATVAGRP